MTQKLKLLPCPFCGGEAELDTRQGYRSLITGRMGKRVTVYCLNCSADMGVCLEDVPDIEPEQVADMWNRRAAVEAARQQRGELKIGDRRNVGGVEWVCTDPDIDRWVCSASKDADLVMMPSEGEILDAFRGPCESFRWPSSVLDGTRALLSRRSQTVPGDVVAAACKSLGWDLDAQEEADMILLVQTVLARPTSGQPAANADPLEVLRRVWQPHTQSNVDRMSEQDIAREIEEEVARQQKEEPIGFLVPATLGRQPTFIPRDRAALNAGTAYGWQPVYSTPQPAELGKVPSDEEIEETLNLESFVDRRIADDEMVLVSMGRIRAAFSRYGQPASSVEPVGHVSRDSAIAHMRVNLPDGTPLYTASAAGAAEGDHFRDASKVAPAEPVSGTDRMPEGAAQFTKKPVTISAIRWTGDNLREVTEFTDKYPRWGEWFTSWEDYERHVRQDGQRFKIFTLEGTMIADPGDWIIRGVKGEHYPCKPDIFEATYDVAQVQPTAKQRYDESGVEREEHDPLERLRFFCSLAMSGQDWLDVEPLFEAIRAAQAQPVVNQSPTNTDGWKEAAIAWEVCASIHRNWAKGKDALFSMRQSDFLRHAEAARAALQGDPN